MFRLAAAAALAVAAVAIPAAEAYAVTGCDVTNSSSSQDWVYVTNDPTPDQSSQFGIVTRGQSTTTWNYNTTGFKVPAGCRARSQYSGSSYPYAGTVVYRMSQNNLHLLLTVVC